MNIFQDHPLPKVKIAVIFLGRKRPGFVPEWGLFIEKLVRDQLQNSAFEVFISERKIVDPMSLREALQECERQKCRALVAVQPTMSDGRMSPVFVEFSHMPVIFWATPEKPEGDMISSCSLVGAHTFAANLAQAGGNFEFVYGMPGEAETIRSLEAAVYRAYACAAFKTSSAGLVGYHAPGFTDMHVEPSSLNRSLGVSLYHYAMEEFTDNIRAVSDDAVRNDVAKVMQLGLQRQKEVSDADIQLSSRYYLAIKAMMDLTPLHALAIRDWPELSASQWPYLAMARLASEGYALACEGDLDGALSCLLGYASGCGACYLSDWLEHDHSQITLWHGGAAPFQLCEAPQGSLVSPQIALHFNNGKPAVVNATLKAGMPVTLFRIWHLNGKYKFTAIEGETIKPKRHLLGTNGLAHFSAVDVREYFIRMVKQGFPHHPVIAPGHVRAHLHASATNLNLDCIE